jgi:LysR family transcriptional regulator, nitrogen assimilation regulatory protein
LNIGIPSSLQAIDQGILFARFLAAHPRVSINLVEDVASGLRDGVASGRLDVAVISTLVPPRGLRYSPLVTQGVGACFPPSAPQAKLSRFPIESLAGKPLIVTSRSNALRLVIEEATAGLDWTPNVRAEMVGVKSMLDLTQAGAGYGVCPMSVHGLAKQMGLVVKPIQDLTLTWAVATSRERTASTGVLRFVSLLFERVEELVSSGAWPTAVCQTTRPPELG